MNNKINHIIENLKEVFDGNPWYGISVMKKLDAIPWQHVNTVDYGSKSIAVLVQHIMNWRIFVLKKLEGDVDYDIVIDSPQDWSETQIRSEEDWNQLKEELRKTQYKIIDLLRNTSDELLTKKVPGKDYNFEPIIGSIAQHDIYHLGQIAMLNTMKKS